jgi:hypothetical protein
MISFSLDPASVRDTKRILRAYERKTGQTIEESVIDIGREASRQAAQKCPPFGLTDRTGDRFKKSIAKQVNRAVKAGNVAGRPGDANRVHQSLRDSKGQVPRNLKTTGQYKRDPIKISEKEALIDKKQAAAGIVKGAWIHAGTQLGRKFAAVTGRKRVVVGAWIRRHLSRGKGSVTRHGINTEVTLVNTVSWVQRVQSESMLRSAVNAAFKGVQREMQKALDKIKP